VVAASGGFQANLPWLKDAWGDAPDNFIIRGSPYDGGRVLKIMLDSGAKSMGDANQCHAIALDARAPKFDGGIVKRLESVPLGIVVNKHGRRFYDEGEDFWPKRYAIWDLLLAQQPDQIAYSIIDSKSLDLFIPSLYSPIEAGSIHGLAQSLMLEPSALEATLAAYNRAVVPGTFDLSIKDDCRTAGGILLLIGTGGLLYIKIRAAPDKAIPGTIVMDFGFVILLFWLSFTGLLLLLLRATLAMGILLAVHIGFVFSFFITIPYGKFVHGIYRYGALVRNALEQK
jgi:precorrin 3B synthase CobZ